MDPRGAKLQEYLSGADQKEPRCAMETPMAKATATLNPTITITCRHAMSFPQQSETHIFYQ